MISQSSPMPSRCQKSEQFLTTNESRNSKQEKKCSVNVDECLEPGSPINERTIWSDHGRKVLESKLSSCLREDQEEDRNDNAGYLDKDQDCGSTDSDGSASPTAVTGMTRTKSLFHQLGSSMESLPSSPETSSPPSSTAKKIYDGTTIITSFATDVRCHTGNMQDTPTFDKPLRQVMEPHIRKARLRREKSRNPSWFKAGTLDATIASSVGVPYTSLREERPFLFDEHSHPLHSVLAETLEVDDLSLLHKHSIQDKRVCLEPLLYRASRRRFHEAYDNFVTSFCIPLLHSVAMEKKLFHAKSTQASNKVTYRYQAFPCIRIVRPGEISKEPHCDTSLGHCIGNLNFHVPLTPSFGTNALYTESHPGREDWHPLKAKSVGLGYILDGARCLHFGLENTTPVTRVSLDFRIAIYREHYHPESDNADGGLCTREMLEDHFSSQGEGYYDEATIEVGAPGFPGYPAMCIATKTSNTLWDPDHRVGFPFI